MPEVDGVLIKLIDAGKSEVDSFFLPTETVMHTITRNPIVFPVPGVNYGTTGQPVIFALDFGMMSEQLVFSGQLKDNEEDPNRPNHQECAHAVRTWWRYTAVGCDAASTIANKILLKEGPGHGTWVYAGVIQSASFRRVGGTTWWEFKITFQIVAPPSTDPAWTGPLW